MFKDQQSVNRFLFNFLLSYSFAITAIVIHWIIDSDYNISYTHGTILFLLPMLSCIIATLSAIISSFFKRWYLIILSTLGLLIVYYFLFKQS